MDTACIIVDSEYMTLYLSSIERAPTKLSTDAVSPEITVKKLHTKPDVTNNKSEDNGSNKTTTNRVREGRSKPVASSSSNGVLKTMCSKKHDVNNSNKPPSIPGSLRPPTSATVRYLNSYIVCGTNGTKL